MKNINRNASFISNRQLLEGMRNKSAKNLTRNRSVQTSISFIQPKKYQNDFSKNSLFIGDSQKENQNINTMRSVNSFNKQNKQQKIKFIINLLKSKVNDTNLLLNIQKLTNELITQNKNNQIFQQQNSLLKKIEQIYIEKTKIKKQKKTLQQKLKQQQKFHTQKLNQLRKQNQRLHKIVLKQSQMITNQALNQTNKEAQDLRKLLLTQAKTIEAFESHKSLKAQKLSKYC